MFYSLVDLVFLTLLSFSHALKTGAWTLIPFILSTSMPICNYGLYQESRALYKQELKKDSESLEYLIFYSFS